MPTLYEEIVAKCTPQEIAEKNYHLIADKVNTNRKKFATKIITERGVRAKLGPVNGAKFIRLLKELNVAAETDTVPGWLTATLTALGVPEADRVLYLDTLGCGYAWLKAEGLDIGDAATRQLLDLIAAGQSTLAASVVSLKAMAEAPNLVTWNDCERAIEAGV